MNDLDYSTIKRDTNESYSLSLADNVVKISAANYFGARHAVETLFQVGNILKRLWRP